MRDGTTLGVTLAVQSASRDIARPFFGVFTTMSESWNYFNPAPLQMPLQPGPPGLCDVSDSCDITSFFLMQVGLQASICAE